MNREFWNGRRVFLTGHTGFKGSWLLAWLTRAGAEVTAFALAPSTDPSLFDAAGLASTATSIIGDIRDPNGLSTALLACDPEVVFHLAAQALVRESYEHPVVTYATNVMGTVHLLEAVRRAPHVKAVVVVTSDKCYENREWMWAYREEEPLGGHDPYSSSKACAELVTAAYRSSYFMDRPAIATARAGNVIGGGDWARDRLVPDLIRAFGAGRPAPIRNPEAVRPWQHVLEPLHGYILLAEALVESSGFADAWNFGPYDADVRPVGWIADALVRKWGEGAGWTGDRARGPHEAKILKLDSSRARTLLSWRPRLPIETALEWVVEWHQRYLEAPDCARDITLFQIARYEELAA